MIKQLSVFIENRKGRLAEVLKIIKDVGVNIYALHIADTSNYGILRLVTDNPDKAHDALAGAGFAASLTSVIAVGMDDESGYLYKVVSAIKEADVSVEYLYAFAGRRGSNPAVVVIKPENAEYALKVLENNNFKIITQDEI